MLDEWYEGYKRIWDQEPDDEYIEFEIYEEDEPEEE